MSKNNLNLDDYTPGGKLVIISLKIIEALVVTVAVIGGVLTLVILLQLGEYEAVMLYMIAIVLLFKK